jgi:hypothetical protein
LKSLLIHQNLLEQQKHLLNTYGVRLNESNKEIRGEP